MKDRDLEQRLKSVARAQEYWRTDGHYAGDALFEDRVTDWLAQVKLTALEEIIDPESMQPAPGDPGYNVFEDVDNYMGAEMQRGVALRVEREKAGTPVNQPLGSEAAALERKTQTLGEYIVSHGGFEGAQAEALRGLTEWMGRPSEGILNLDYNGLAIPFDYYYFLDLVDKVFEPARQLSLEKYKGVGTP